MVEPLSLKGDALAGASGADAAPQPPQAEPQGPCAACHLPALRCPAAHPGVCPSCSTPFSTTLIGYADVTSESGEQPAETWASPGRPPATDPYGHPLTWGAVLASHATLVQHASHSDEYEMAVAAYDSDDSGEYFVCPCQYHDALIERGARRCARSRRGLARASLRHVFCLGVPRVRLCP